MPDPIFSFERTVFNNPPASREVGPNDGTVLASETFTDSGGDNIAFKMEMETHWGQMKHTALSINGSCSCLPTGGGSGTRRATFY